MRSPKVAKAVPGNCTPSFAASQDAAPGAHAAVAVPAGNCGHIPVVPRGELGSD